MEELGIGLVLGFFGGLAVGFSLSLFWQRRAAAAAKAPPLAHPPGQTANLLDSILGGSSEAAPAKAAPTEADRVADLRQNLRLKFLFDETKVEEAIAQEKARAPQDGMKQWLEAAIYRWERENR